MHVSIDTDSHFMHAICHAANKLGHIQQHCLVIFTKIGVPETIKMDSSSTYTSGTFRGFAAMELIIRLEFLTIHKSKLLLSVNIWH